MTNDPPIDKPPLPPAEEPTLPTNDRPIGSIVLPATWGDPTLPTNDPPVGTAPSPPAEESTIQLADEMLGFVDGYPPGMLLQMSEEEIATLDNPNLVNAVKAAKLLMAGQRDKMGELLNVVPDVDAVKIVMFKLLDGRYPLRARDFIRIFPEQLRLFSDLTPFEIQGAELAQLWFEGDRMAVVQACDNAEITDFIGQILADEVPEEGEHFTRMIKRKGKDPFPRESILVEGYTPNTLLAMSDTEIAALGKPDLANAIDLAKLAVTGQDRGYGEEIEKKYPNFDTVKDYALQLLDGKVIMRPRDYLRIPLERLRNDLHSDPSDIQAAELAQFWWAGDEQEVYDACDNISMIDAIYNILVDVSPEEGEAFNKAMVSKREELTPTPKKCVALWLAGGKLKAWRWSIQHDIFDDFFQLLEQVDPQHVSGSVDEFINSPEFTEMPDTNPNPMPECW